MKLGEKPKRLLFHPRTVGEGKTGWVNVSESLVTPRQDEPRIDGCGAGVQGWLLESSRWRSGASDRSRDHHRPGVEAAP